MTRTTWWACVAFLAVVDFSVCQEAFACKDDVHYVENDCNACSCTNGNVQCTRMLCPASDPALRTCKVNTSWTTDCNRCWCDEILKTICEDKPCGSSASK